MNTYKIFGKRGKPWWWETHFENKRLDDFDDLTIASGCEKTQEEAEQMAIEALKNFSEDLKKEIFQK